MRGGNLNNRRGIKGAGKPSAITAKEKEAKVMEFAPHAAGKHQSATCDAAKEHVLQELQTDSDFGHDLADNLRDGADNGMLVAKPERGKAIKTESESDETGTGHRQEGSDMEFNWLFQEWRACMSPHDQNWKTACSMTFGCCNATMQRRIEESTDFEKEA